MNDQEKSVLLAKVMGWQVDDPTEPMDWKDEHGKDIPMTLVVSVMHKGYKLGFDFYLPENMALSWSCLNWGLKVKPTDPVGSIHDSSRFHNVLGEWLKTLGWGDPSAQRAWLDKILELAIEAGLAEVQDA